MRVRLIPIVASIAAVLAAVALLPASNAGAVLPGVVDLSATLDSKPTVVAPAGELVLLEATVRNVGVVSTGGSLRVDLPAGAWYRDDLSSGGCSGSATAVTCSVGVLAPGASEVFQVVAHTPTTVGVVTSTATVRATLLEPLEYRTNNTDTATTDVQAANPAIAAGLIEEGGSLTLEVGDGRTYTVTVPEGVPGVIVRELSARNGTAYTCGPSACGNGFLLDFVQHPYFKAEDPTNPLQTLRTFGPHDPCQGLGSGSGCNDIYFAKSDSELVLENMEYCPGADAGTAGDGTAVPSPCINQKFKTGGSTWFDVRLLSDDPLELPPLTLLNK